MVINPTPVDSIERFAILAAQQTALPDEAVMQPSSTGTVDASIDVPEQSSALPSPTTIALASTTVITSTRISPSASSRASITSGSSTSPTGSVSTSSPLPATENSKNQTVLIGVVAGVASLIILVLVTLGACHIRRLKRHLAFLRPHSSDEKMQVAELGSRRNTAPRELDGTVLQQELDGKAIRSSAIRELDGEGRQNEIDGEGQRNELDGTAR